MSVRVAIVQISMRVALRAKQSNASLVFGFPGVNDLMGVNSVIASQCLPAC